MTHAVKAMRISGSFWAAFGILLLAAGISGCASFKEVRAFATLSSKAASYDGLTRDYIAALDRRKQYQPEKFHAELEAQKIRREAQRTSLDLLQQTVTDYMQVLDSLASGESRTYDKSLTDLGFILSRASLLDNYEKQVVGALSIILARAATTGYRLRKLKKLIHDGNQPLQDVIEAARKIVKRGILADLQVESALVERYYDNIMLAPDNPWEPVAIALAKEAKVKALGRVESLMRNAENYDFVLEKIAQGQQYVYDYQDMIGDDEFERQLKQHISELSAAYKNLLPVSQ